MKSLAINRGVAEKTSGKERLFALDLLKAICITAVVSYHGIFVPRSTYRDSFEFLEILGAPLRFCVPVLFTISFLLLERSWQGEPSLAFIQRRLYRLAIPTIFWFSVATLVKFLTGDSIQKLVIALWQGQIFQGAYYLIVLIQLVLIFFWFRKNEVFLKIAIVVQCIVFGVVIAILNHRFSEQLIVLLRAIHRPLLLYWFIYVPLGILFWRNWALVQRVSAKIQFPLKALLLATTGVLMAWEYSNLFTITYGHPAPFEYVMFSCPLSVFTLFLCFASVKEENLSPVLRQAITTVSNYSLGIFCVNGLFSDYFLAIGSKLFVGYSFNLGMVICIKIAGWITLFGFSLGLSILLDRLGLKAIVR
jgi:hypothetical protein